MTTFKVLLTPYPVEFIIEAESEDEAYDKAYEAISLGKPYDIEVGEFTGEWRAELS